MRYLIAYMDDGIPCGITYPERHSTLEEIEAAFREFIKSPCVTTSASAMIYVGYTTDEGSDDWALALEFAEIGCPFDYPDYRMDIGPLGGVRRERC